MNFKNKIFFNTQACDANADMAWWCIEYYLLSSEEYSLIPHGNSRKFYSIKCFRINFFGEYPKTVNSDVMRNSIIPFMGVPCISFWPCAYICAMSHQTTTNKSHFEGAIFTTPFHLIINFLSIISIFYCHQLKAIAMLTCK